MNVCICAKNKLNINNVPLFYGYSFTTIHFKEHAPNLYGNKELNTILANVDHRSCTGTTFTLRTPA